MLLALAACERGPQAPTAQENQQLNEMENLLDEEANRSGNDS